MDPTLPMPPLEMRQLVGPLDPESFDNPGGRPIFDFLPPDVYESVFDFGCGCGRLARQLIQQRPRPALYVGIDLHRGMVRWCQDNLTPWAPYFHFFHHDVYNPGLNPNGERERVLPFPVTGGDFSLVIAWSVFTHLAEWQAAQYFHEVARVLRSDGIFLSTWFLFDQALFPAIQGYTNALYISDSDPSGLVLFNRGWVPQAAAAAGLTITGVRRPTLRGYQWTILMERSRPGLEGMELPEDDAPMGNAPRVMMPEDPARIGLKDGEDG